MVSPLRLKKWETRKFYRKYWGGEGNFDTGKLQKTGKVRKIKPWKYGVKL